MNIFFEILFFGLLIVGFYFIFTFKTKKEKEYDEKLKESLADEYIIDPETGAKLTLEEAESGHWISHDNEFRKIPDSEIEKLPTEEEKIVEKAINYLRESKDYRKTVLTEKQVELLENCKILKSYDDWSYSNPFSFLNGILILPAVELRGMTYYQNDYCESHVLFWKKIKNINGHYFFREKSSSEKLLDLIRNDDEINFENYECFTIKKSFNIIYINNILKNFKNQKELEFEIHDENLFVKSTKLVNLEDILRIENIIKNVC